VKAEQLIKDHANDPRVLEALAEMYIELVHQQADPDLDPGRKEELSNHTAVLDLIGDALSVARETNRTPEVVEVFLKIREDGTRLPIGQLLLACILVSGVSPYEVEDLADHLSMTEGDDPNAVLRYKQFQKPTGEFLQLQRS
jgi:hypothetical protein